MKVWLLHVGEELPGDGEPRLFRYGRLAEDLARRGHQVVRWAPTFNHFRKCQRHEHDTLSRVRAGYDIHFVRSAGFRSNVSLGRLLMYRRLASRFDRLSGEESRPDLIVAGLPSLEWCRSAVRYADRVGIPAVIDIRDLWPDIYANLVPASLRPTALRAISPLRRSAGKLFARAHSLVAVSESYLDWGLALAKRDRSATDRVIPLGYQRANVTESRGRELVSELEAAGVDQSRTIACFAGLLESSYDIAALIEAARHLERTDPGRFQVVVAGDGSKAARVREAAEACHALVSLGWVTPETIHALMGVSEVGLAAYAPGALQTLPNKVFEYLSAGLAVVSSLPGEFDRLLWSESLGHGYRAGDGVDLAKAVRHVAADRERLAAMQSNARRLFEARFTAARVDAAFADHLESLVDDYQGRPAA